ncbi:MAG: SPOR domain-containing protein [Bacteroidota bacterium]
MIDVNTAIKELLLKHQRVVLPGIGAFITEYKEAEVDNTSNTFKPPQKEISFDSSIANEDDTLIADFFSKSSKLDAATAKERVDRFLASVKEKLDNNEQVILPHIGSLKKSSDSGKIIFVAQNDRNFLLDAYGFDSFTLEPKKIEKVPKENQALEVERNAAKKRWIWIPAAVLVLLIILTGYAYFLSVQKDISFSESLRVHILDVIAGDDNLQAERTGYTKTDTSSVGQALDEQTRAENALALDSEKTVVEDKYAGYSEFVIIAGSFTRFKNAEKLKERLEKKGFNPSIRLSDNNYYRVSLMSFTDRVEALDALNRLQSENKDLKLWLLSK